MKEETIKEIITYPVSYALFRQVLKDGKWDYLKPDTVDIPIDSGYEKKVWFDMPEGTKGVLVESKEGDERVYMITSKASDRYEKETKHDREPVGKKLKYRDKK